MVYFLARGVSVLEVLLDCLTLLIPSQKSKPRFNREKARFHRDQYNFNGINQDLSKILS